MPPGHPVTEYWGLVTEALARLGVNLISTLLLDSMMRDAGFVNVRTRIFALPVGPWPQDSWLKLIGLHWRTILLDGLQAVALGPLTRGLGWTQERVEVWLVEIRRSFLDERVHSLMPLHIICGQRPKGETRK